ncbi:unnamed protein product [Caenorhabditis nigoni]
MTAKFLILIFCLSSVVIANELSEEFLIDAVGESNSITEQPEYYEEGLLSGDTSEIATVQLGSNVYDGSGESSGETSEESEKAATQMPENPHFTDTPETPDNSSQLLDFFKMAAGSLILLIIGSVLIVTIFGIGFWMRKMINVYLNGISDLHIPQDSSMKPIWIFSILLLIIIAFTSQKVTANNPNTTTFNDPSMGTSTTSLFTRVFQMLVNTMFMIFVVVFTVILALLLIDDLGGAIGKKNIACPEPLHSLTSHTLPYSS